MSCASGFGVEPECGRYFSSCASTLQKRIAGNRHEHGGSFIQIRQHQWSSRPIVRYGYGDTVGQDRPFGIGGGYTPVKTCEVIIARVWSVSLCQSIVVPPSRYRPCRLGPLMKELSESRYRLPERRFKLLLGYVECDAFNNSIWKGK